MATLPESISSMKLLKESVKAGVAILPGIPFYPEGEGEDTIRINVSSPRLMRSRSVRNGLEQRSDRFREDSA